MTLRSWILAGVLSTVAMGQAPTPAGPETLVRGLLAAFNAHDVPKMLTFVSAYIRWLTVEGEKVTAEAAGASQLEQSMTRYFRSVPTAHSELKQLVVSGHFVSAVEEAQWQAAGESRRQCSLSVYEIREQKVKAVWYFPAHRCD